MTDTTAAERMRRYRTRKKAAADAEAAKPLMFERADWQLFLDPATLPQKAGCSPTEIGAAALKELVDNALDSGASVTMLDADGAIWITDDGPGIDPDQVAALFAVNRPMLSSKLKRRPLRGMLGNGLRVVMGAVAAYDGKIAVSSRGRRQELTVDKITGKTIVLNSMSADVVKGTRIEISFHPGLIDEKAQTRARLAIHMAREGRIYRGPSRPSWYSANDLRNLMLTVTPPATTVGRFLSDVFAVNLDDRRIARELSDEDVRTLHAELLAQPVDPVDLGAIGPIFEGGYHYAIASGEAEIDGAAIPHTIETWVSCSAGERGDELDMQSATIVNGTLSFALIRASAGDGGIYIKDCGLDIFVRGPKRAQYTIFLSIITPYLKLINDGKTPYLASFETTIKKAIKEAALKSYRTVEKPPGALGIKEAAYQVMGDAYLKASDDGKLPAKARQIMYAARGDILRLAKVEKLNDQSFTQNYLPDFIAEHPEIAAGWDVVYDARGHFVEPHTGRNVPLGTISVREYLGDRPRLGPAAEMITDSLYPTSGPKNRYRNVLFVEKEGFDDLWRKVGLAERYDLAIMSTKGMSTTAARMLLDRIAPEVDRIFVLHDFDISGFSIFGTLGTDSRRYTFENYVPVIDIGLRLDVAREMGLESEPVEKVNIDARAETLRCHGATEEEIAFLATRRVELNAMTSRQLVDLVESEMEAHGVAKVIPDDVVLAAHARRIIEQEMQRKAFAEVQARVAVATAQQPLPIDLAAQVRAVLESSPELSWDQAVARIIAPC
jgi:Histidine kinase-, DNA gyrase B-, and HSP90-like ATPase